MSLKGFHIIFIIFAALCDCGFWVWTRVYADDAAELGVRTLGMMSGWFALAIVCYGVWFVVKKARHIIV